MERNNSLALCRWKLMNMLPLSLCPCAMATRMIQGDGAATWTKASKCICRQFGNKSPGEWCFFIVKGKNKILRKFCWAKFLASIERICKKLYICNEQLLSLIKNLDRALLMLSYIKVFFVRRYKVYFWYLLTKSFLLVFLWRMRSGVIYTLYFYM